MKLAHPELEFQPEIKENEVVSLVLENQGFLTRLVSELKNQIENHEGSFVLSDGLTELPVDKNILLITDPFNLEFNSKKVLSVIYSDLSLRASSSEFFITTCEMLAETEKFIASLCDESDVNLDYNQIDVNALLKIFNVRVSVNEVSFKEKLTNYLDLMSKVMKTKVFVFLNLHSFLSNEDLKELYRFAFLEKVFIITIDTHIENKLDCEKVYVVDNDLCAVY